MLFSKKPTTIREVCDAISQAELAMEPESSNSDLSVDPSAVILSHLHDVFQIIQGGSLIDFLPMLLRKCLGTEDETCPISVYNYLLLENFKTKIISDFAPKKNGDKHVTQKASRKKVSRKSSDNVIVYGNDGKFMWHSNRNRAEWHSNIFDTKTCRKN